MAIVAHYGGVFVVPTTSPAWNADPEFFEFRWRDGVVSDQPMRLSPTLPTDSTGAHRYEMQPTTVAATNPVHCRPAGGVTHSGIQVSYRPKADAGPWSAYSSYAGQYVTPAVGGVSPVIGNLAVTPTSMSVGQTATANWDVNPGNGTGFNQSLQWLVDDVVVVTQTPDPTARSATHVLTGFTEDIGDSDEPVPDGPLYPNSIASTSFHYIHDTDPNAFVSLSYKGWLVREVPFAGNINVHVYEASFTDSQPIEMYMAPNPEDGSTYPNTTAGRNAALADANKYTGPLGRLPRLYRLNIDHMIGYAGNGSDDPSEDLTSEDQGHFFMIFADRANTRIANNDLNASFFHEGTHASIQVDHLTSPEWLAAVAADGEFVTEYAETAEQEDFAEHALLAYTLIFHPERIPEPDRTWIAAKIPNRIAFFRDVFGATLPTTLKARLTASSSVSPASTKTSNTVSIVAGHVDVGPSISSVTLDKPAYTTGDTARVKIRFSAGNGTGLTVTAAFKRNGVTFQTVAATIVGGGEADAQAPLGAAGSLTVTATVTTSVSSANLTSAASTISVPRPPRLTAGQWRFVEVVAVAGFTNRFTGRFSIDVEATATQWSTTPSDSTSWRPTSEVGDLYQLQPAASGGTSHLVGFGETSEPIFVRYSTAGGTSDPSETAQRFVAPLEPPPGDDEIPAPEDDDWEFAAVVAAPGLTGRFTAQIKFLADGTSGIDDTDIVSVEWIMPARLNEWGLAVNVGEDDGILWQMRPVFAGGASHSVGPEQESPDVFVRYTTLEGTSGISVLPKRFTGGAAPARPDNAPAAGTKFLSDDLRITVGGRRMISARDGVPGVIQGEISVSIDTIEGESFVTIQLPTELAPGAEVHVVNYGGRRRTVGPNGAATFPYVAGSPLWLAAGVNAIGRGVDRYGFVPEV